MDSIITISPDTKFKRDILASGLFVTDAVLIVTTATDKVQLEFKSLGAIEQAVSAMVDLYLMALREQEFALENEFEEECYAE